MTKWERAFGPCLCGGCGKPLERGDPVFVFLFPGPGGKTIRFRKVRCVACAGEAPPELPATVVHRGVEPSRPARFTPAMLPLDWKTRAIAAREPGEEG